MSDSLTERLNKIRPKLISDDFLSGSGIGNEIAFYIFDYPPEEELHVREHVQFLLDDLPKARPGLRVMLAAVEKRGFPAVKGVGSGSPRAQPVVLVLSCGRPLWIWFTQVSAWAS